MNEWAGKQASSDTQTHTEAQTTHTDTAHRQGSPIKKAL